MRRRLGCFLTLAIVGLACIWLWHAHRREERLEVNFNRVAVGMSDAQVITMLGKPKWRGRCGTSDYYSFVEPIKNSADCLVYAAWLAPLNPWYPVIFLSADNRVIDKYAYASP
jgi:hypothetical protein